MFDKVIQGGAGSSTFIPMTLNDILFNPLPHRDETCDVIYGHVGEQFISVSLRALREITRAISEKLKTFGLKSGDTIMLASFSSSNELANALIFTGAACSGIRVFVPIFPEPTEFDYWKEQTGFACVIMPFRETLFLKGFEKEKEVVYTLQAKCRDHQIPMLDANTDFLMTDLIRQANEQVLRSGETPVPPVNILPQTEAVIFTTSGTSGRSKLLVYTHEGLANCCQAWQQAGLFDKKLFGSPGFSPLFTHTIGIRTFLNAIWSGHPFCIAVTGWFLQKPEVIRYLLLKMKPGYIIAGPAFFNTMLELFRQYPELKTGLKKSLQAAISIGAPYDDAAALKFKSATGISLMNGFGTTETLMVSLNKPDQPKRLTPGSLGQLLPGVTVGLKQTAGDASLYELSIHADFQAARTIGEQQHAYFETGDLVRYDETTGEIFFHGRKSSDFIKDEYGVKIPLGVLRTYYKDLCSIANWIEWIPLVNIPGLSALIFLPASNKTGRQKEIAALVKNTNEQLKRRIEPFEYAHRHIERIGYVYDEVPLTRKGTVSKNQIYKQFGQFIEELRNPFVFNQHIEITDPGDKSVLSKFSNPNLAELLEALKLDKVYVKGEGDYLFYREGEAMQRVTDYVGGFGANLLGHNHPKIREAMIRFLESGYPALNNQGSQYYYPALLARELNRLFSSRTGKYFKVQFGSGGTEATEIALHHAYFEWRQRIEKIRDEQLQLYGAVPGLPAAEVWDKNMQVVEAATPCVLVVNNCFHGYSPGARSLLNHKKQRYLFSGLLRPQPLHISDQEAGWEGQVNHYINNNLLEIQLFKTANGEYVQEPASLSKIIASIIEPVKGEGGIYEINPALADLLARQEFPLISDEIQCGLGRTGSLPACEKAAYYLLGKSLGGGVEKISAVLIDEDRFKPAFTKYFNSTFANGELAASIGLAALKIIEEEKLPGMARVKGEQFLGLLRGVAARFPDIVESVNGKGLMIGIQFNPNMGGENNLFRVLIEHELLGYLLSGWLLNKRHIRVLPSLSKPNSIRIEPSCYLPESEMLEFCDAFGELCSLCREKAMYELFKFLMNGDNYEDKMRPVFKGSFPQQIEQPAPGAVKVGFIGNFTLPHRELQVLEPDFQKASDTGLRILFNRLQVVLEGKPVKIMSKNLLNGKAHFTFYVLPFDASQMEVVSRWGKKRYYIAKIQEAVDAMAREGAASIILGAHTSIITSDGLNIAERANCRVLTGNSLTVASCLFYLNDYLEQVGHDHFVPRTIAIVGAAGNIGSGLAECLGDPEYAPYEILLVGNNEKRLQKIKNKMPAAGNRLTCTSDLFELRRADVIIGCTNTNDPIIFPHHIREDGTVFVIDISVPSAISNEVKEMKNIEFCKEASSVYLPGDPEVLFSSHTPKGKVFCCAAESILCTLYDLKLPMKGHVHKDVVQKLMQLALKEGFFKHQSYAVPV